jgi:class 3 adenylate cyclase
MTANLVSTTRSDVELVALCLTDVVASSALWCAHPEAMPRALDLLDDCVDAAARSGDGTVVRARGEGDSHFVVFPHVSGAVHAAARLQQSLAATAWPADIALRVRAAVHVGEIRTRDDSYVGTAINRAARLRSIAHGGQIVAGAAVVELASDLLDRDLRFESLGRHRIRDFSGWTEVFQLCGPALEHDFPPLATLDTGLPPLAVVVLLDCVDTAAAAARDGGGGDRLLRDLAALFATDFAAAQGEYLKQVGDGCLALFVDPDAAVAFARSTRDGARRLGIELRGVIDVGRVEFVHHEPIGAVIHDAARNMRRAPAGRFVLGRAASTLGPAAADLVEIADGTAM